MSTSYTNNYPTSGYASETQLRTEFDNVRTALEDTISRSNQGSGSNAMEADLDMGSNDLINVDRVEASALIVNGNNLEAQITSLGTSATDAAAAASAAQASATAASISETNAANSESTAQLRADLAADSATAASNSAAAAATSETNAASSAADASTSATEASGFASQAQLLTNDANTFRNEAQASAAEAATAITNFHNTYYGSFSFDPTEDPNGNPITDGDMYFNNLTDQLRIYNGTAWVPIPDSGALEATQAQAEAGAAIGVFMSPLRTQQWFDNFKASYAEIGTGSGEVRTNSDLDTRYQIASGADNSAFIQKYTSTPSDLPAGASGGFNVVKIGEVVTISGNISHTSATTLFTNSNSLPTWATPNASYTNTYAPDAGKYKTVFASSMGRLFFRYLSTAGANVSDTTTNEFTISYIVPEQV